ncbi:type II toxin-antitoxin system Phd/YefM family antitoxin [Mycolicibacterium setense]|uniref:Antitoxin n=1 Tax=Mycolicibacterium setense TaxID=431269 RepID=A0ABR4YWR1_9MYCO|nr:type II toxin-antitoxin system prevent-host-death family antitoxin [Mycolicibacterium setense]KHO22126.1 prevent-host-death protein [Mycolicibacterium setense]KHO26609.1 prevent-host-death protein [Mycolicibacterium setense]MCV7113632.1 type II toxin-antitoxin system prevent-host-death family antitoxin [Mycolicibacterium setense]OBB14507.1 prevent-host-death protein [Mycolicibacterium setense]
MKTTTSTEAKARLNALLAEVAETGESVTITNHGKPVAILSPATPTPRRFGQLAGRFVIPEDFDAPLDEAELALWEGNE